MSDEITPILSAVNGRAIANLVPQDEKTFIVDAVTGQKIAVIDGFFGGGGKAKIMTTEERTAITPEEGQMIFDSTLGALFVGDGATPGGTAVGGGEDDVPGYRLDSDGEFLNFNPVQPIVNVTGNSVTLQPDTAYKMYATTGALNVTANPPAANYWGLEGHAEIFVGSVGYVVFDTSKIVLANQLEPDSVNNCTLRFHDGMCYVSVEDHIAGYIVVSATGTAEGSLPYGLTSATQEYVAFDATTNGATVDLSGSTASAEKHLVGNGFKSTTLTGAVDCGTSKFTMANLALQNVSVNGGTMTLGDVYIPNGSTVAVSGGGLAVEKVTGAGSESVIDLGGTHVTVSRGATANGSGLTFIGGSAGDGGAFYVFSGTLDMSGCVVSGNRALNGAGLFMYSGSCNLVDCIISGNTIGAAVDDAVLRFGANVSIVAGNYGTIGLRDGSTISLKGNVKVTNIQGREGGSGTVTISSGTSINLTSSIAPGGAIEVLTGGCTVNGNAIPAGTYTSIDSNGQPT